MSQSRSSLIPSDDVGTDCISGAVTGTKLRNEDNKRHALRHDVELAAPDHFQRALDEKAFGAKRLAAGN